MEKLYFTSHCVKVVAAGIAQTHITRTAVHNSNESSTRQAAVVYVLESPDRGSVNGHNNYEGKSKAEKFLSTSYTAGYNVVAGFMFIAQVDDGATPTTMEASLLGCKRYRRITKYRVGFG